MFRSSSFIDMPMCRHGDDVLVRVPIPANLSHTGASRWDMKGIDLCIAPIIAALNAHGILTASSCCGHGKGLGTIVLQDGRELVVMERVTDGETKGREEP